MKYRTQIQGIQVNLISFDFEIVVRCLMRLEYFYGPFNVINKIHWMYDLISVK